MALTVTGVSQNDAPSFQAFINNNGGARAYSASSGVAVRIGCYDDLGTCPYTFELGLGFPDGDGGFRGIF